VCEDFYTSDHIAFRDSVRTYVEREVAPHLAEWDREHHISRTPWEKAGDQGFLGVMVPEEFGGNGARDFRYRCIVMDELARVGAASLSAGISMNEDIVSPYLVKLGSAEQQARWLPKLATGRAIAGIAMTEPGAGSDLRGMSTTAVPRGDGWLLNGSKTFITNGIEADFVIVAAKTGSERSSLGLFLVEDGMGGFSRGRQLDKIGLHAQDTAELFFDDVELPPDALIGSANGGFGHLMDNLPIERLAIAYYGLAGAAAAVQWTIDYTKQRHAFGKRIIDFQNTRFELASLVTETDVSRAYMQAQVLEFNRRQLTAEGAAKSKWWMTEMQKRVVDRCLQLFGGFGYMYEYPIARAYVDARVQTIYGGTTEIMKEIIGRALAAS
jgi:alkylation response protein AidB-like acyl-CoA dehydrogenase